MNEPREKVGEGYEAEIFAWDEGRVLRLFREGLERGVEAERIAIPAAIAAGIPAPRMGEPLNALGRAGDLFERIHGENLLDRVGRLPWTMPREAWETGRLHARLHAIPAPDGLEPLHDRVSERLAQMETPPRLRPAIERALEELPAGDRLCHGDFHPGNILRERDGRRVVIDWGLAAAGPPEGDAARTLSLILLGEPINPLPALRVFTRFFRPVAAALYLRGYRSLRALDEARLWRWTAVRACDHLLDPDPSPSAAVEPFARKALARARRASRDG